MTEPREQAEQAAGLRDLHPPGEGDPELLAGDPMPDPWNDPEQTDWPDGELDLDPAPTGEEGGG
jgi:hypothetical protein